MAEPVGKHIRRRFIAGLLVVIPLALTALVFKLLFNLMDGLLGPFVAKMLGIRIPGLGIIATVVLVFLAGIIATNLLGKKIVDLGEKILARVPVVKTIYLGSKQLAEALLLPGNKSMKKAVLVEWSRKGVWIIGFVTNTFDLSLEGEPKREIVTVFVPTTPNPTTGFVFLLPKEEVVELPFSSEAAFRLIMSGGLANPFKERMDVLKEGWTGFGDSSSKKPPQ